MPKFVPGDGPSNAKIVFVAEAPGYHEDEEGRPLVGASGSLFNNLISSVGLSRSEVYVTNVSKFRPPDNDWKRLSEVCNYEEQLKLLKAEIQAINPKVIVAMGEKAIIALTGRKLPMRQLRGSILPSYHGPKVVCTYHPAALLRSSSYDGGKGALPYWMREIVKFDFKRAVELFNKPHWQPPSRNIIIARSSLDVYNFFNRHRGKRFADDIESPIRCVPLCIGVAASKHEAIVIPLFQKLFGVQITSMPHTDIARCWEMLGQHFINDEIYGQNFKYDQDKLERLWFKIKRFTHDTMLAAKTLEPEMFGGLGFLTSIYTEEPFYKDEGQEFVPGKDNIDNLFNYCGKDSCCTYDIAEQQIDELKSDGLYDYYRDFVHPLHELYLRIEEEGLRIDFDRRKELTDKYEALCAELLDRMKYILLQYDFDASKFNPRSPKQVAFALYDVLGIPRRVGTGEEVIFALLGNTVKNDNQREFCRGILSYRKAAKTKGNYLDASPDYDRRMRTSFRILGTETGRSSTSILEPPIRPDNIGIALQTMTKHGDIGSELRSQYIPDEGFVFLECDLEQAEPRIVAHLSEDDELAGKFDTIDIHKWTAELALSIPYDKIQKGSGERHIGKTLRNAGNYNIGKREFMINCNTSAAKYEVKDWHDISEWRANKLLETFHDFTPKVKKVFHRDIIQAIEETRTLWDPFGGRRIFRASLEDDKIFKEAFAHIPQKTVRGQVVKAMLDAKKEAPELRIILEFHDSVLTQVPINDVDKYATLLKGLLERPIDFSGCTLKRGILWPKASVEIGENWKDLKSYRIGEFQKRISIL